MDIAFIFLSFSFTSGRIPSNASCIKASIFLPLGTLNNTIIVAKIVGMSEQLLFLSYGPLEIIVKTVNSINKNIFLNHFYEFKP